MANSQKPVNVQTGYLRGFFSTTRMPKTVKHFLFTMMEGSCSEELSKAWLEAFKDTIGYSPIVSGEMHKFIESFKHCDVRAFIGSYRVSIVSKSNAIVSNDFRLMFEMFMAPLERYRETRDIPIGLLYQTTNNSARRHLFFTRQYVIHDNISREDVPVDISKDLDYFRVYDTLTLFGPIYAR